MKNVDLNFKPECTKNHYKVKLKNIMKIIQPILRIMQYNKKGMNDTFSGPIYVSCLHLEDQLKAIFRVFYIFAWINRSLWGSRV